MQAAADNHAQLMDSVYRGQRHIYDLTRKYYLLGRDDLISDLNLPQGGTVLEVGCGTGRNLALMGRYWPLTQLFGLDISDEMLKSAKQNLSRADMMGRAKLAKGDAADFDAMDVFGRTHFDRIVFSYTLSMIPDWQGALRQAFARLSKNGSIHIVDFGMQQDMPDWFRSILLAWLRNFHVAPRDGLAEFVTQLAKEAGQPCRTTSLYRDYTQMTVIGRAGTPK